MKKIFAVMVALYVVFTVGCTTDERTDYDISIEYILEVMAFMDDFVREIGAMRGYGDDGIAAIHHHTRWRFETQMLPQVLLRNEERILYYIASINAAGIEEFILPMWEEASAQAMWIALGLPSMWTPRYEAMSSLLRENTDILRAEIGLNADQHILGVDIEQLSEGITAAIITLYYTGWDRLSSYMAIVYIENRGLEYYRLERRSGRGNDEVVHFLWHIYDANLELITFRWGGRDEAENTREAFIEAILLDVKSRLAD